MAKKVIKQESPDDMFYSGDRVEILRLFKITTAQQRDLDSIYYLYKKYIKPNAAMYKINCTCPTSISSYYQSLLDWYGENGHRFNP